MKFVHKREGDEQGEWLFDLSVAEDESQDLKSTKPKEVARLQELLAAWEDEVVATR